MRVNRIYFRGLKTFQCVFCFSTIWALGLGCVNLGEIELRTIQVATVPRIVDIEVHGACDQAQVMLRRTGNNRTANIIEFQQIAAKQTENAIYHARVDLDAALGDAIVRRLALSVVIQCPEHGEQVIGYPDPPKFDTEPTTPDWAKGLVWYQVFPERFRDGNPNNNPNNWDLTPISWNSSFSDSSIEEIERAWNRRQVDPRHYPYDPNRSGGSIATTVFARRYGGDLIGVYNQLESLKGQGYTGIYLCPVFQSRSLHKYDADDHRHIDPTLGHPGAYKDTGPGHTQLKPKEDPADESTWEWTVSDRWFVDEFLPKARSLGLKVVLDGVWNHVGTDHFAFADVVNTGNASSFVDWFDVEFDDEGNLIAWKSWGSVNGNLPVFRQTEDGDLAPGPKAHIMAVTRRWMDPNGDGDPSDGIDGWRLDVAGEIGKSFWKDWRAQVKQIKPEALIIAEIWSDADRMLNNEGFDGQMNYPFAYAIADWLSIGNTKGDAKVCAERLTAVFHHAPAHDLVQFNLMTSHDTERLASMMHNDFQRGYDNGADRWAKGSRYDPDTITQEDMDRALAAIAMMVASPGSVMMYNGDEYALPGADDPDNRRPIPWGVLEDEQSSNGQIRVRFNRVVNGLLKLRTEEGIDQILRFGSVEFVGIDEGEHAGAMVVRRTLNNRMVEFLIPNAPIGEMNSGSWKLPDGRWRVESERSRKYGMEEGNAPITVRYLYAY